MFNVHSTYSVAYFGADSERDDSCADKMQLNTRSAVCLNATDYEITIL